MKMRKLIIAFVLGLMPVVSMAASGGVPLMKANNNLEDKASLQRGARLFVNYCLSCHSAKFMRYNRLAADLGLSEEQVMDNLMFGADKITESMDISMDSGDSEKWFGTLPPDLSVIARSRGTDWLYTYLLTFYKDESRPFGVNNLAFKDVGMPHVLWKLQGVQEPVYKTVTGPDGREKKVIEKLEVVEAGELAPVEYKKAMRDLVNFLDYMGEPGKLKRQSLGVWVLLFLVFFFFLAYALKKDYWRDIH